MNLESGAKLPATKAPGFFSIPFLGASAALERAAQVPGARASTEAQALMAQVKLRLREVFLEAAQKSVRNEARGESGVNANGELLADARAESGTDASPAQGAAEIDALNSSGAEGLATSQPNSSTEGFRVLGNAAASERPMLESVNTLTDASSAVGDLCDVLQKVLEHGLRQNVPGWDLGLMDGVIPGWRKGGPQRAQPSAWRYLEAVSGGQALESVRNAGVKAVTGDPLPNAASAAEAEAGGQPALESVDSAGGKAVTGDSLPLAASRVTATEETSTTQAAAGDNEPESLGPGETGPPIGGAAGSSAHNVPLSKSGENHLQNFPGTSPPNPVTQTSLLERPERSDIPLPAGVSLVGSLAHLSTDSSRLQAFLRLGLNNGCLGRWLADALLSPAAQGVRGQVRQSNGLLSQWYEESAIARNHDTVEAVVAAMMALGALHFELGLGDNPGVSRALESVSGPVREPDLVVERVTEAREGRGEVPAGTLDNGALTAGEGLEPAVLREGQVGGQVSLSSAGERSVK
jgi:hypothetical protein